MCHEQICGAGYQDFERWLPGPPMSCLYAFIALPSHANVREGTTVGKLQHCETQGKVLQRQGLSTRKIGTL